MIRKLNKAPSIFYIIVTVLSIIGCQSVDYPNPQKTFEIYKKALAKADIKTYMVCITEDSKQMLSQRPPLTSAMSREYQDITKQNYQVRVEGETAVLEFNPANEITPPYLFKKEGDKWKIDLKRMSKEISFDQNDHWCWKDKSGSM